jgi:hypothetical protein
LDADDVAQLKKGAQDTLSDHVSAKVYLDEMGKQEKLVQDFKIEPKKALKTLELDPKAESKLAKAPVGTRTAIEKKPGRARQGIETQDQRQANARRA